MAQEEHLLYPTSHSSGDGGGGGGGGSTTAVFGGGLNKSRTAAKGKKVPQRGLGVAQLEKIRLEEQREREAALQAANALANTAIGSIPNETLPIQCPNFVPTNENWFKLWKGEINPQVENPRVENFGPGIRSQYMANAPTPRSYRLQLPSSSTVSASSEISVASPLLNSKIELPSNQSVRGNKNSPSSWPEEVKTVGMKRSCPFSLESSPVPSLSGNFRPAKSRSVESQAEPRYKYMRDSFSNSNSLPEQKPNNAAKDDGRLKGDFLTLAPPTLGTSTLNSKDKHASNYLGRRGLQSQENQESRIHRIGPGRSTEQEPLSSEEKGETIDLTLKL